MGESILKKIISIGLILSLAFVSAGSAQSKSKKNCVKTSLFGSEQCSSKANRQPRQRGLNPDEAAIAAGIAIIGIGVIAGLASRGGGVGVPGGFIPSPHSTFVPRTTPFLNGAPNRITGTTPRPAIAAPAQRYFQPNANNGAVNINGQGKVVNVNTPNGQLRYVDEFGNVKTLRTPCRVYGSNLATDGSERRNCIKY